MDALLALILAVQEVKDGTYTNEKHKIRLTAPKGWSIEAGEDDTLCNFGSKDPECGGQLDVDTTVAKFSVEQKVGFQRLEETKDFKRVRDEKLKKSPGDWLARECPGVRVPRKTSRQRPADQDCSSTPFPSGSVT